MEIELKNITVQELVKGYQDSQEDGVVGFDGTLNIRPPYQREFVYKDAQREAVIDTITRGFPLNTMYWAVTSDGFEVSLPHTCGFEVSKLEILLNKLSLPHTCGFEGCELSRNRGTARLPHTCGFEDVW